MDTVEKPTINFGYTLNMSLRLVSENISLFLGICIIVQAPAIMNTLLAVVFNNPHNQVYVFLSYVIAIAGFLFNFWGTMALTYSVSRRYQRIQIDIYKAFTDSIKGKYFNYVAVSIAQGILIVAGALALIIPGMYLGTIFAFATIVVVLENRDFMGAFKRSKDIVDGHFWQVLFFCLLMMVLVFPLMLWIPKSDPNSVLVQAMVIVYNVFLMAATTTVYVTLYHNICELKGEAVVGIEG